MHILMFMFICTVEKYCSLLHIQTDPLFVDTVIVNCFVYAVTQPTLLRNDIV